MTPLPQAPGKRLILFAHHTTASSSTHPSWRKSTLSVLPTYTATCPHPLPSPCHPPLAVTHCHVPHAPAAMSLMPQPPCPSCAQHHPPHAHTATSVTPLPSRLSPPCHWPQPHPV